AMKIASAARTAARQGAALWRPVLSSGAPFSTLTVKDLPRHVVDCEYAVRGAVLLRAEELQSKLANQLAGRGGDEEPLPFDQ
ncbi:unnamed protein product, partial [Polarella glacialis]